MVTPAAHAVPEQQPPPGGRVPVGPREGVGLGNIETYGGAGSTHENSPVAWSRDQACQDMANSATSEIRPIIAFCPCSAQSWIMSVKYRRLSNSPPTSAIGVRNPRIRPPPRASSAYTTTYAIVFGRGFTTTSKPLRTAFHLCLPATSA